MEIKRILELEELPLKEELKSELSKTYNNVIDSKGFLYAEGEIPVLLIAHLDVVHKNSAPPICWSETKRYIMSPNGIGGDDRCGVYMIMNVIKQLKCHVLFCEQEEVGCLGAKDFCKSDIKPDVNYIIEFDRKGSDDSVFYDCDNKSFEDFVNSVGFKTAWGSCSDISHIAPHLGIAAVNLSSGYYNAHSLHEYIDMKIVERNIQWALNLINSDYKTKYAYIKKKSYTYISNKNTNTKNNSQIPSSSSQTTEKKGKIKRLLQIVDKDFYWIFDEDFNIYDYESSDIYIDKDGCGYIGSKVGAICVPTLQVIKKTDLMPIEFNWNEANLEDIMER